MTYNQYYSVKIFETLRRYRAEPIIRALKRKKRVILILHTNERFGYIILEKLKEWLKSEELGYLAKNVALIVP